ncbi:hypothetical protein QJS10_CPB11g01997 [Acorus calamus]|uniref:3-dehydroquinate synthase domain-containing protein n=1 Tax=Acorus calamus TaxID=4465 RepID=A0AAV9DWL9_ACOCL|nr:hypothetical protein QJS10_CPB11g01997 [Acorus calamus]
MFVALGGGVIGDMCGFAAAAFLHGVNFIQILTTLMAQPQCVLIDTDMLSATLPNREPASGIAEVVKYGLEKNMQALLSRDPGALAYAIKRSCENKAEVISSDEKESGLRTTLNLGHTFGHVDKKVADGLLQLILLKGPLGNCVFTGDYDQKALSETLHAFCRH